MTDELTLLGREAQLPPRPRRPAGARAQSRAGRHLPGPLRLPEFASLCPVTGQPDFAHLVLDYVPGPGCSRASRSSCSSRASATMPASTRPAPPGGAARGRGGGAEWLRIGGYWYPRGGIPIDVFWRPGAARGPVAAGPGRAAIPGAGLKARKPHDTVRRAGHQTSAASTGALKRLPRCQGTARPCRSSPGARTPQAGPKFPATSVSGSRGSASRPTRRASTRPSAGEARGPLESAPLDREPAPILEVEQVAAEKPVDRGAEDVAGGGDRNQDVLVVRPRRWLWISAKWGSRPIRASC